MQEYNDKMYDYKYVEFIKTRLSIKFFIYMGKLTVSYN